MIALQKITVLFTLILASSLLLERFIEFIKTVFDLMDSRFDWHRYWTKKTKILADKLEHKLKVFEYLETKQMAKILEKSRHIVIGDPGNQLISAPVLSGDLVRSVNIKIYSKVLSMALGIGMAIWFELDFIQLWKLAGVGKSDNYLEIMQNKELAEKIIGYVLTGMIIGLGSGPVHKVISQIEKRKPKQTNS